MNKALVKDCVRKLSTGTLHDISSDLWIQICTLNFNPDPEFGSIWIRIQGYDFNFMREKKLK